MLLNYVVVGNYVLMVLLYIFSFKKSNNNAQGGQSRGNVTTVNPLDSGNASTPRGGVQNGAHVQPQLHGMDVKLSKLCTFLSVWEFVR